MDITVSLQFHNEGWLAHPTLRALHRVVGHAERSGKQVEVVATLDRTRDEVLRRIVERWRRRFRLFEVHELDLGDPALCRNFVVQRARGRFLAPHDGDNLYGEDWLTRAHDLVRERPRSIAHPELIWIFEGLSLFWVQEPVEQLADLVTANPWDTVCLAEREVFQEVPYRAATRAYAYEDWAWNCDTIAAGFEHAFVPGTIVAKRQRPHAESNEGAWLRSGKTLPPLPLVASLLRAPASPRPADSGKPGRGREPADASRARRRYRKAKEAFKRRYPSTFRRLMRLKHGILGPPASAISPAPAWAVRELDQLRLLEPALGDYTCIDASPIRRPDLGRWVTPEMGRLLDAERPAVLLLPRLDSSADLEALLDVHALEGRLCVILTGTGRNRRKDEVPAGSTVIDLTVMDVARPLKLALLHRLLLECRPRLLHNVDSAEAYELFCTYPASFEGARKCATVFGARRTASAPVSSPILPYLPRLLGFFDRISTDSEGFRQQLIDLFGLPEERVVAQGTARRGG
jgi:hypothetical protein